MSNINLLMTDMRPLFSPFLHQQSKTGKNPAMTVVAKAELAQEAVRE